MNSKLIQYSDEIPLEIRMMLKALSNDDRLGVLISLMKNGKMSFNEMKEKFELSPSSLSNHLTSLQDGNLIENFYEKGDDKEFSYYDVTDIPESLFDTLFDILYKPTIETEDYVSETVNDTREKLTASGSLPSIITKSKKRAMFKQMKKNISSQRSSSVGTTRSSESFNTAGS